MITMGVASAPSLGKNGHPFSELGVVHCQATNAFDIQEPRPFPGYVGPHHLVWVLWVWGQHRRAGQRDRGPGTVDGSLW